MSLVLVVVGGIFSLAYLDHSISELSRGERQGPLIFGCGVGLLIWFGRFLPRRERGLVIDEIGLAKLRVAGEYDARWSEVLSVDPEKKRGGGTIIRVRLGPDSKQKSIEIWPSLYGVEREELLEILRCYRRKAEEAAPRRPFWPVPGLDAPP